MHSYSGRLETVLKATLADPWSILFRLLRRVPIGSFSLKADLDLFDRPHYAYCVHQAALLARGLGLQRISAIEFGVAGGNGLVALERLGALITRETGIDIEIYGFDRGSGLPPPADYRDLPYIWEAGYFKMDVAALKSRLAGASLVLGDVADTAQTFFRSHQPAPIGFVAFDLDYYSSTVAALNILDGADEFLLPRIWCYFDDIVGGDQVLHCDDVGQLRAIREFNDRQTNRALSPINGLRHKRYRPQPWCDSIYAMHSFAHPLYNKFVGGAGPTELPL